MSTHSPPTFYRGTEAQRALNSTVPAKGDIVITDEGGFYLGNGVTQAKSLLSTQSLPFVLSDGAVTFAALDSVTKARLLSSPIGSQIGQTLAQSLMGSFVIADPTNHTAFMVQSDGSVSIPRLIFGDHVITFAKLGPDVAPLLPVALPMQATGKIIPMVFGATDQTGRTLGLAYADGTTDLIPKRPGVYTETDLYETTADTSSNRQVFRNVAATGVRTKLTPAGSDNFDPKVSLDAVNLFYKRTLSGVTTRDYFVPITGGISYPRFPDRLFVCWGESTTYGADLTSPSTQSYPAQLTALLSGVTVVNEGMSGQSSTQVAARAGGYRSLLTLAGNSIAASGATNVTALSINILTFGSTAVTMQGTLAGIHGALFKSSDGTVQTFTPTATQPGPVACPVNTPFFPDDADIYATAIPVIWTGRNNAIAATVTADVQAIVSYLKPYQKRFIVLPVCNGYGEDASTSGYNSVIAVSQALAATFPNNFFDIRAYLIAHGLADAGITPTTQDTTDMANDNIPTSLHQNPNGTGNPFHYNAAAYGVIAAQVKAYATSKGWLL